MRAVRAAIKLGLHVVGFEINPRTGTIMVHTAHRADDVALEPGDWDKVLGGEDQ
jgi:hypothetical protein